MTKSLVLCKIIDTNFSILFYFFQEPTLDSNGVEIKEPLDTIFVKSVRESGPAHLAGLQCGEYWYIKYHPRIATIIRIILKCEVVYFTFHYLYYCDFEF